MIRKIKAFTIVLLFFVAACSKDIDYVGSDIDFAAVEAIKVGDGMHEVLRVLGTPAYRSTMGSMQFVYLEKKIRHRPILHPKVESFDTVVIYFNSNLQVDRIEVRRDAKLQDVDSYSRQLEIKGNKINPMKQILGNIGKYNAGAKKAVPGRH